MSDGNDISDNAPFERTKLSLEIDELRLKVATLQRPDYKRTTFWLSVAAALVAVVGVFAQGTLSSIRSQRADLKVERAEKELALAQIAESEIQKSVDEKTATLATLEGRLKDNTAKLATLEYRLKDVEGRYEFVNLRMEDAIVLLARVKNELPDDLRKEVEAFEFPKDESAEVCGYETYLEVSGELEYYRVLYKTPRGNYFLWTWSSQDSSDGGAIYGEWMTESEASEFISEHGDNQH